MNPKRWVWNVLVTLDFAANTIGLMAVEPATLSKRAAKARDKGKRWGCVLCAWLDRINSGHCDRAPFGP